MNLQSGTVAGHNDVLMRDYFEAEPIFPAQWLTAFGAQPVSINITEDAGAFRMEAEAPGRDKNDFHVILEGRMLTLLVDGNAANGHQVLSRCFRLPDHCNPEAISASCTGSTLTLRIPKPPAPSKKEVWVE